MRKTASAEIFLVLRRFEYFKSFNQENLATKYIYQKYKKKI